jgi:hypothetical protein
VIALCLVPVCPLQVAFRPKADRDTANFALFWSLQSFIKPTVQSLPSDIQKARNLCRRVHDTYLYHISLDESKGICNTATTIDTLGFWRYIPLEEWEVEFTDEFGGWWGGLTEAEQVDVRAEVNLLRRFGPMLGRPHVDSVASSKHANMKELRVQHRGRPYRVLFAFDPRRTAVLLIGGNKTGKGRWYKEFVPMADRLYDEHLETLRREGSLNG